ncbi:hypothetical protein BDP27DRAFT_1434070 [Rhodocollybia butyracea]|uniref:Uncharacterized protein n=1 Tax=Rhodocollybia butyracea TaxID=206335 RepID=A0A9P5P5R1_9AGAR|nr:hypothetical protein BDP27DRAFT_1434070 [Rhodocollybia butyracea]
MLLPFVHIHFTIPLVVHINLFLRAVALISPLLIPVDWFNSCSFHSDPTAAVSARNQTPQNRNWNTGFGKVLPAESLTEKELEPGWSRVEHLSLPSPTSFPLRLTSTFSTSLAASQLKRDNGS